MNSKSLAELQRAFALSQHYQTHDLDIEINDGNFSADQCLQVYRNNYIVSLSDVLAAGYPTTQAVVGEACFRQLARYHVLRHPLTSGDVTGYGEGLAQSINEQSSLISAVPYLADLALLEWAVDQQTRFGEPEATFPIAELSQQLQQEGEALLQRIVLVPNGQRLNFSSSVGSLWHMVRSDQIEQRSLMEPEMCWVQYRQEPQVLILTPDSAALIELAQQARPLAEATEGMLQYLTELIQQQVFTHFWENRP